MIEWLYKILCKLRDQKRHEVYRLRWEKAELEAKLKKMEGGQEQNINTEPLCTKKCKV